MSQIVPNLPQMSYDNDEWDDDWDDDDSEPGSSYPNGPGNFGLSAPNRSNKPANSVGDISTAGLYGTKLPWCNHSCVSLECENVENLATLVWTNITVSSVIVVVLYDV